MSGIVSFFGKSQVILFALHMFKGMLEGSFKKSSFFFSKISTISTVGSFMQHLTSLNFR